MKSPPPHVVLEARIAASKELPTGASVLFRVTDHLSFVHLRIDRFFYIYRCGTQFARNDAGEDDHSRALARGTVVKLKTRGKPVNETAHWRIQAVGETAASYLRFCSTTRLIWRTRTVLVAPDNFRCILREVRATSAAVCISQNLTSATSSQPAKIQTRSHHHHHHHQDQTTRGRTESMNLRRVPSLQSAARLSIHPPAPKCATGSDTPGPHLVASDKRPNSVTRLH